MRTYLSIVALLALVVLSASNSNARTWLVDPSGTGDAPTIQAAIDSSTSADDVVLVDGTYTGTGNHDIDFRGKLITVRSLSGNPSDCIIDCEGIGRGFYFHSGEGPTAQLIGILITNGYAGDGSGVAITNQSSPKISDCVFKTNSAGSFGGAISCWDFSRTNITNCSFSNNTALSGGAVYINDANPLLTNCIFDDNEAANGGGICWFVLPTWLTASLTNCELSGNSGQKGGAVHLSNASPDVNGCTFTGNCADTGAREGGAIYLINSSPVFTHNLIDGNSAGTTGGGIHCTNSFPTFVNCTFCGNSAGTHGGGVFSEVLSDVTLQRTIIAYSTSGEAVFCSAHGTVSPTCCDFFGNEGGDWIGCVEGLDGSNGNFTSAPEFCDRFQSDFTLAHTSPCLPENHPDGYLCVPMIGALGEGCSSSVPVRNTTWGQLKDLIR